VHKSQGSQWDCVGLVHDRALDAMQDRDAETYRRLVYTAVTRAAKELIIFEV
jgi:ATP-dependent exoDNAse (exonuclease V) alpha subunit